MDLSIEVSVPNTALFRGEGSRVVQEELVAATEYGVNALAGAVIPRTPANLGLLRQAWQTRVNAVGTSHEVLGRLFNLLGYALPVETGSRPHWPPIAPLILWAKRKFSLSDKEARATGFLVARKISREGTRAWNMAKDGLAATRGTIEARYAQALVRVTQRLGGHE
jgi:hypothetical protein